MDGRCDHAHFRGCKCAQHVTHSFGRLHPLRAKNSAEEEPVLVTFILKLVARSVDPLMFNFNNVFFSILHAYLLKHTICGTWEDVHGTDQ